MEEYIILGEMVGDDVVLALTSDGDDDNLYDNIVEAEVVPVVAKKMDVVGCGKEAVLKEDIFLFLECGIMFVVGVLCLEFVVVEDSDGATAEKRVRKQLRIQEN